MKIMISTECGIIGAGRLGSALSCAMTFKGYRFNWVASKNIKNARKLAGKIGCENYGAGFEGIYVRPKLIIFAVPDGSVEEVSSEAVSSGIIDDKTVVLHTSGVLSSDVLHDCRKAGASVAAFHPCQTITLSSNPS